MSGISAFTARCDVRQWRRFTCRSWRPVLPEQPLLRSAVTVFFMQWCVASTDAWSAGALEPTPNSAMIERLRALDRKPLGNYGIRNNCININRIRSIQFEDDQTAIVDVGRRRKVILTLRRNCRGISNQGYIQRTKGSTLCAKYDRFEVLETGIQCQIESLQPYVRLENDVR